MKRYLLILLAVLVCAGCGGKKKSLKVEDPVQRAALRTRDASCPIDSMFTSNALGKTFDIVGQVKPKALFTDFKEAMSDTSSVKPLEKVKNSWSSVKAEHSEEYSSGLTVYSTVIVLLFVFLLLFKVIRAIFKNDRI